MSYRDKLRKDLIDDEGKRLKLYRCTAGKQTIGIGHNIEDRGISEAVCELMFQEDVDVAERDALALFPGLYSYSDRRKAALINMSFQLGFERLKAFKKMRAAVNAGDWNAAAAEALDSAWAKQTQASRVDRVIADLREG
jgi:lysozyme